MMMVYSTVPGPKLDLKVGNRERGKGKVWKMGKGEERERERGGREGCTPTETKVWLHHCPQCSPMPGLATPWNTEINPLQHINNNNNNTWTISKVQ